MGLPGAGITAIKLLLLTHRLPYPPNRGDRIRTYHMLRFLSQWADIYLGCLTDEPVASDAAQVLRVCAVIWRWPASAGQGGPAGPRRLLGGKSATEGFFAPPIA